MTPPVVHSLTEIPSWFEGLTGWTIEKDGIQPRDAFGVGNGPLLPTALLNAYHPRLLAKLTSVSAHYSIHVDRVRPGYLARHQEQLALRPFTVQDVAGNSYCIHHLWEINPVRTGAIVLLTASLFHVYDRILDNHTLVEPFVRGSEVATCEVSTTWLDKNYPGWLDRLHVAQGLGYTGAELTEYVRCASGVTKELALPAVPLME